MRDTEASVCVYRRIDSRYLLSTMPRDQLSELFKHQALVKRHIIAGCLSVRSDQENRLLQTKGPRCLWAGQALVYFLLQTSKNKRCTWQKLFLPAAKQYQACKQKSALTLWQLRRTEGKTDMLMICFTALLLPGDTKSPLCPYLTQVSLQTRDIRTASFFFQKILWSFWPFHDSYTWISVPSMFPSKEENKGDRWLTWF